MPPVATGRYGGLDLSRQIDGGQLRRGRVEIGIRLEEASGAFLLADHPATDPKILFRTSAGWEARTFCCCRDGEVVGVNTNGRITVSGRADGPPSGRSNVGLLVRPPAAAIEADPQLVKRCLCTGRVWREPVAEFVSRRGGIPDLLGDAATDAIVEAIDGIATGLGRRVPSEGDVWAVAVEGVGRYPELNAQLQWGNRPVWVAGDATGLFRGLTAAFVSGYFSGLQASAKIRSGPRR